MSHRPSITYELSQQTSTRPFQVQNVLATQASPYVAQANARLCTQPSPGKLFLFTVYKGFFFKLRTN